MTDRTHTRARLTVMNTLKWALAAMTVSLVAACGGSGNAGTSPFGSGGGCSGAASSPSCSTAQGIDVIASQVEVGSGGDTATISAIVKDSNNVGLENSASSSNKSKLESSSMNDKSIGVRSGTGAPC